MVEERCLALSRLSLYQGEPSSSASRCLRRAPLLASVPLGHTISFQIHHAQREHLDETPFVLSPSQGWSDLSILISPPQPTRPSAGPKIYGFDVVNIFNWNHPGHLITSFKPIFDIIPRHDISIYCLVILCPSIFGIFSVCCVNLKPG